MIKIPASQQFGSVVGLITGKNCKYVVPGWYQVPADTQLHDIEIDQSQTIEPTPPTNPTGRDIKSEPVEFSTEISSSKGDKTYKITKSTKGKWACTCPAFQHQRGECKHIKQVKKNKNG